MTTHIEEGEVVTRGDEVVRALLAAIAALDDLVTVGHDSHIALNALEEIAHELGSMEPEERRRFIEGLDRVAAQEPDRAAWIGGIPDALGLDR
ncbi:hypothetical protein ACFYS8_16545 [Kitasatospora sp. NPDC004615]|uniref:hypothetical protein n=1 Tax=unclassified Kitasatospora TaxID=2633591 RepID=UPI0036ABD786